MLLPEVGGKRAHAVVKDVRVLERLVAVVILGVNANNRRLDAQVDVFRNENDARVGFFVLQRQRLRQDGVVVALARKTFRQRDRHLSRLEEQAAGGGLLAMIARVLAGQLQPPVDLLLGGIVDQLIEKAADLTHAARGFGKSFLVSVQLFEHDHRQIDVVLLESENRGGVVHQHVGVEYEQPAPVARPRLRVLQFARGARRGARIRETSPLQELPPRVRGPSPCAIPCAGLPPHRVKRCCALYRDTYVRRAFSL